MFENYKNSNFEESYKSFLEITKSARKISNKEIDVLFLIEEKELVNTFLEYFDYFSISNLIHIEKKINRLLFNRNREYVSDLIDFATFNGLNLNYMIILNSLSLVDEEDEHYVILSALQYISENIKYYYLEEIFDKLETVLESNCSGNIKVISLLIMYKISHLDKYLVRIEEVLFNEEGALEFFKNRIENYDFEKEFFDNKKLIEITKGTIS